MNLGVINSWPSDREKTRIISRFDLSLMECGPLDQHEMDLIGRLEMGMRVSTATFKGVLRVRRGTASCAVACVCVSSCACRAACASRRASCSPSCQIDLPSVF